MINNRTILDIGEEKILFINEFLIDQCLRIEPDLDLSKLQDSNKLVGIALPNEQIFYFYNKTIPLIYVDLKLLIDGV